MNVHYSHSRAVSQSIDQYIHSLSEDEEASSLARAELYPLASIVSRLWQQRSGETGSSEKPFLLCAFNNIPNLCNFFISDHHQHRVIPAGNNCGEFLETLDRDGTVGRMLRAVILYWISINPCRSLIYATMRAEEDYNGGPLSLSCFPEYF